MADETTLTFFFGLAPSLLSQLGAQCFFGASGVTPSRDDFWWAGGVLRKKSHRMHAVRFFVSKARLGGSEPSRCRRPWSPYPTVSVGASLIKQWKAPVFRIR